MLIFGLNLSSRRKKRFPGIDDVMVARPCHWSTSADRFVDMTLKEVLFINLLKAFDTTMISYPSSKNKITVNQFFKPDEFGIKRWQNLGVISDFFPI